jgi:hypothetical protein
MEKLNKRTLVLILFAVLFMFVIIALRVIAPLSPNFEFIANFSGVGAVAIFSAAYLKNKFSVLLMPALILFLSDLGLVFTMGKSYGFYEGWYYTYIALMLMVLIGRLIINKISVQRVLLASVAGVFAHWIISDYGVWLGSTVYPQNLTGFWACLVAAIPYELNFLVGTLVYAALMFSAFEVLTAKYPTLRLAKSTR